MFSLTEAQKLLRSGEISSRELVFACLERITALDGTLHSFLHVDAEGALKQADEADHRRRTMNDGQSMPLLGIPLAVKDVLTVEGMPCTCGSRLSNTRT